MRPIQIEPAVGVLQEKRVVVVGIDAGVGLAGGDPDRSVVVSSQRRIQIRELYPGILGEALPSGQLDTLERPGRLGNFGGSAGKTLVGGRGREIRLGGVAPAEGAVGTAVPESAGAGVDDRAGGSLVDRIRVVEVAPVLD